MARAMEHQPALLLGRLDWHKPHIGSCDRLADGLGVGRIVLLPFDVRLDVGRRHQPTVWPSACSSRDQWCDEAQASMPTRQGGSFSKNART